MGSFKIDLIPVFSDLFCGDFLATSGQMTNNKLVEPMSVTEPEPRCEQEFTTKEGKLKERP